MKRAGHRQARDLREEERKTCKRHQRGKKLKEREIGAEGACGRGEEGRGGKGEKEGREQKVISETREFEPEGRRRDRFSSRRRRFPALIGDY